MKYLFALIVALGLFFSASASFAGTGDEIKKLCLSSEEGNKEDAVIVTKDGREFVRIDGKLVEIEKSATKEE